MGLSSIFFFEIPELGLPPFKNGLDDSQAKGRYSSCRVDIAPMSFILFLVFFPLYANLLVPLKKYVKDSVQLSNSSFSGFFC